MKRLVLAILVVLSLAVGVNAQTFRGAINGTVTDPSGAVVPNAQVKATENSTGIDHTTVTTSDGAFAFQDIPLGFYKVTVTASGFPVYTVDKVEVTAGTIYTLAVKLTMQQQATTVEVSAAALTLDTTTQTQNMTITSDVVQDMPLNGRDFTQLIGIAPGFGGYAAGGFGSVNGTRANQINWQIDGVDNNDFYGAHSPFFAPTPGKKAPPLRNENYGFTVGGPIIKNKAFFFLGYEKQDYIIGL